MIIAPEQRQPDVPDDAGYRERLESSRGSLCRAYDQTPWWRLNDRDDINETIKGIERILTYLEEKSAGLDTENFKEADI